MCAQAKQNNKSIDYFPSTGRYSAMSKHIPSLLLLMAFDVQQSFTWDRIFLWSLGVTCPAVSLPASCIHHLLTGGAACACAEYVRNRKDLDAVQALPNNNESIPELSIPFSADIQTMELYELLWTDLTLFLTKPLQNHCISFAVKKNHLRMFFKMFMLETFLLKVYRDIIWSV